MAIKFWGKCFLLAILLLNSPFIFGAKDKKVSIPWIINKDHSEVFFRIGYLTLSEVTGRIERFRGLVKFDEDLELAHEIVITMWANSINTANKIRDGHLLGNDFFKVKSYPYIRFKSTKIDPMGPSKFKAEGLLTLKDVTQKAIFFFNLSEGLEDTWGYKNKFVQFKGEIDRKDFHITWNKSLADNKFLVGDKIKIWGNFQIQPKRGKTPTSKHMIPNTTFTHTVDKYQRGEVSKDEYYSSLGLDKENARKGEDTQGDAALKGTESLKGKELGREQNRDFRKGAAFKIAFLFVGFMGFLSTLIVCFQGKSFLIQLWSDKYNERNFWGILSDFLIYPLFGVFLWAMWIIGFA